MNRYVLIVLCLILFLGTGCRSVGTSTPPRYAAEDGTLYHAIIEATATVLKDGQIAGAGAFISEQGHFLTAAHVVRAPRDRIELLLHDGSVVRADVVARDLGRDLAVLHIDEAASTRNPNSVLAFSDALPPPGAPIFLIGAPSKYTETMIPGRVARERVGYNFLGGRKSYIQSLLIAADAAPGSSGGCWVNQHGQIVGVQSAYIGKDLGSLGLGFISPVSTQSVIIREYKDQPTATLGGQLVGLRTQSLGFSKRFPPGAQGVAVHEVFEGGALQQASIPTNHLITHVNGQPVADIDALCTLVRRAKPGDTMRLTVLSPGEHKTTEYDIKLQALVWN